MPPKTPTKSHKTSTDTSATASAKPTAVTVIPKSSPLTKHERPNTNHPPTEYVSPLKKLRKTMQDRKHIVIDTIDDLREFIKNNDVADSKLRDSIRIQARLLWVTNEYINGLRFLRVYLGEQKADEPLLEQQTAYQKAQQDDPYEANQYLITLSLYDIAANNPDLPSPGSIIVFKPTKLRLYHECCQVESKLQYLSAVTPP
ncbi:hypothetical protein GN958_ATG10512 [Phytophthora infestans]|uniref:Uncharacterized protein n=1 Tax=Phytophthora infestans TaxID=4787 RepID=A0A8S9UPY4_PHYIN|nr:hypothetical protein GN958_ATG10512 [Phytophthora infestans]